MKRPSQASPAALHVVVRAVRPLERRLTAALERGLAGTGVGIPMRGLLERLYEAGPETVPALARALGIPRQFALRLAREAEARGHVERAANPAHRRSTLVRLTDDGRAVIAAILEREAAPLRRFAPRFDPDDVEAAARVLTLLAGLYGEEGG